jgi:A/G-specific adenine glycosylase
MRALNAFTFRNYNSLLRVGTLYFFISFSRGSCISRFNKFLNSKSKIKNSKLVARLLDWFSANARDLPWRRTRDPYAIWVSEIMLQQTQVKTVLPYWERWMRELPTIESVAAASADKIHKLWEGLGYYTRVRNLQNAAKIILEKHSGKFPKNFDDVLALPGIGRYTAGAICSIAFNQPTPILDGNVIRVLTRIFGIGENPKAKETNAHLWRLAGDLVWNSKFKTKNSRLCCSHLNQSLMELGALICTPRNPQCKICPVKKLCIAFKENRIEELPNLGKRELAIARHFVAFVIERNGKLLVRQRTAGIVNAHLWEFPNTEIGARLCEPQSTRLRNLNGETPITNSLRIGCGSKDPRSKFLADVAQRTLGFTPKELQPFCTIKHSITRYRITLEAFRINSGGITRSPKIGIWKTPAQLQRLAFSSAHKRILNRHYGLLHFLAELGKKSA